MEAGMEYCILYSIINVIFFSFSFFFTYFILCRSHERIPRIHKPISISWGPFYCVFHHEYPSNTEQYWEYLQLNCLFTHIYYCCVLLRPWCCQQGNNSHWLLLVFIYLPELLQVYNENKSLTSFVAQRCIFSIAPKSMLFYWQWPNHRCIIILMFVLP